MSVSREKDDGVTKKSGDSTKLTGLRRQAEELLQTAKRDIAVMPVRDMQRLVHELQIHQIELEMQNEELRRTQVELEVARDRYADLYDFSPAGHLTLDTHGTIVEANLRVGALLGIKRKELIGQSLARFIAPDDQDLFYRHCREVLKTGTRQICEVRLQKEAGVFCCVHLESLAVHDELEHITHWRTSMLDISDRKRVERELRESETRLQAMLDCSPSLIFIKDLQGSYLDVNQQFERTFHLTRQDIIGKTDYDIFPPEQAAAFRAHDLKALKAGRPLQFEEVALHDDGPHTNIVSKFPLRRLDGTPYAICGITADITERKRAEEALRARKHEFRLLADNVPAFYAYVDHELRYRFVNKRYEELFGLPASDVTGRSVKDMEGEANFEKLEPHLREALGGQKTSFIYPMVLPNVDTRWMSAHYMPDADDSGRIRGILALATDVTAQKQAELALHQSQSVLKEKQEELQTLAEKLLTAQDEERQRIARELHDDFSQRLAALMLEVVSMEQRPPVLPELISAVLEPVREQLEQLSDDLHNMAYKLHPSLLQHAGLLPAIEDHIGHITARTGLRIILKTSAIPNSLPLDQSTCLFRVLQESLQNIIKHANATEVMVKLSRSSKGIGLSVTDDGKGFNAGDKSAHQKGLGLISMQERLRLLDGFSRVHSTAAHGTKVCAWIPGGECTP